MANKFSMNKTFNDLLVENRSLMFPISKQQFDQLESGTKNTASLVSFFEKDDFPAAGCIKAFIKVLDIYNGKLFDNWKDYISLSFDHMDIDGREAVIFDISVDPEKIDIEANVMYRRWWKALKSEKPTVVYYVKTETQEKEEQRIELFKVINKQAMNRDKKEELTKSVGQLVQKKEQIGAAKEVKSAGETVGEPEKGIDYLIKKRESRKQTQVPPTT